MPTLKLGSILLVPISKEDYPLLHEWRNKDSFLNNLTHRHSTHEYNEFVEELEDDFRCDRHLQFMINIEEVSIGTIYSYGYNPNDGYAFTSIYITNDYRNNGFGLKTLVVFSRYLFQRVSLYKIYLDVYEYNDIVVKQLKKTTSN